MPTAVIRPFWLRVSFLTDKTDLPVKTERPWEKCGAAVRPRGARSQGELDCGALG